MTAALQITRVAPSAGVAGGEVDVSYVAPAGASRDLTVLFDGQPARSVATGSRRAVLSIPETNQEGRIKVTVIVGDQRAETEFIIGRQLADSLHPVTNPVF